MEGQLGKMLRATIAGLLIVSTVSACSTNGGMYKENDEKDGKFSLLNTFLLPFAVAGAVVAGAAVAAADTPPPASAPRIVSYQGRNYCMNGYNQVLAPKYCGG